VSREQLPRSKVFEPTSSAAKQAISLQSFFVVRQYLGIQLLMLTDGPLLLSR
jgi:hypothetical protein